MRRILSFLSILVALVAAPNLVGSAAADDAPTTTAPAVLATAPQPTCSERITGLKGWVDTAEGSVVGNVTVTVPLCFDLKVGIGSNLTDRPVYDPSQAQNNLGRASHVVPAGQVGSFNLGPVPKPETGCYYQLDAWAQRASGGDRRNLDAKHGGEKNCLTPPVTEPPTPTTTPSTTTGAYVVMFCDSGIVVNDGEVPVNVGIDGKGGPVLPGQTMGFPYDGSVKVLVTDQAGNVVLAREFFPPEQCAVTTVPTTTGQTLPATGNGGDSPIALGGLGALAAGAVALGIAAGKRRTA